MSTEFVTRPIAVLAFVTFLTLSMVGQQSPPPATPAPAPEQQSSSSDKPSSDKPSGQQPSPETKKETKDAGSLGVIVPDKDKDDKDKDKNAGTSNDRLFFALPNFLTLENGANVPPLTAKQKFKVVARGSFDYIQVPWYLFLSGISQAENSEPGYGQGWEGYAKRFGSAFADGAIENFITGALLPSVLHQDPRFFQTSKGSFTHRAGYAVSRIFITRTDSGHSQFNYSEIVGSAMAASISTYSYHPRSFITHRYDPATGMSTPVFNGSDRTLKNTASVWGSQVGYDTITIVVKEFWPDVHRKISKKHRGEAPASPSANP